MTSATDDIRNIALVGHAGAGKTLLAEALLFGAGSIRAKGSLVRGTTVCDHDPQARRLQHSIDATICWLETGGSHVNLIDTPGYPDFIGRTLPVLEAVETAEEAEVLRRLGIDYAQGYFFLKPLPGRDLARVLEEGPVRSPRPGAVGVGLLPSAS